MRLIKQIPLLLGFAAGYLISRAFCLMGVVWAWVVRMGFGPKVAQDYGNALMAGVMRGGQGLIKMNAAPMPTVSMDPVDVSHEQAQAAMAYARGLEDRLQGAVGAKVKAIRVKTDVVLGTTEFLFITEEGGIALSCKTVAVIPIPKGVDVLEPLGSVVAEGVV